MMSYKSMWPLFFVNFSDLLTFETGQISSYVKKVIIFKIMVQAWYSVLYS